MTPAQPGTYKEVAARFAARIGAGEFPPGSTLPKIEQVAAQLGVARGTAQRAYAELEAWGLVRRVRRLGTVVRSQKHVRLNRPRMVFRDERGYYFDPAAKPWVALGRPTVERAPAPSDVAARLMLVDELEHTVVRARVMGEADTRAPMQLATSFLRLDVAGGTVLEDADTGPGGIYDRMEIDMGWGPLSWDETISARMPTETEAKALRIGETVPLLRVLRTTTTAAGVVVEVNDTRMDASRFEIGHPITRHPSAAWPESFPVPS